MRKFMLGLVALLAALGAHGQDFTQSMTPAERAATGIERLSAEELAQLKAIVERYKSGEVAVVKKEAEQKVAVAEAKVKEVEAKAAAPETDKKQPSWIGALLTLQKLNDKPDEAEVFNDHLKGKLQDFEGKRRFTLQSGQVWEMIQADRYSGPTLENPQVTVKPGALGVYWLKVTEANVRYKVKLIKVQ